MVPKGALPPERSPAQRQMPSDGLPVPGVGYAGQTICPFMSVVHPAPCVKGGCELWVELTYGAGTPHEQRVGRCSLAWLTILGPETRMAIERLAQPNHIGKPAQELQDAGSGSH
jgi:hypothetical protein